MGFFGTAAAAWLPLAQQAGLAPPAEADAAPALQAAALEASASLLEQAAAEALAPPFLLQHDLPAAGASLVSAALAGVPVLSTLMTS